ncbi:hypothetical protein [Microvirga roseola]|uniref:hypothetical protein n=1 Tax=Microvirga roseola TaxID=2883126 RepID=UPI001E6379D1|nr:hypothetical protein [Microvirga roseola]
MRLVPGQAAYVAILSHDIFTVEPEVVETQVRCEMTILDGEIAFDRLGQFASAAE